jgi:hypothetical protein
VLAIKVVFLCGIPNQIIELGFRSLDVLVTTDPEAYK